MATRINQTASGVSRLPCHFWANTMINNRRAGWWRAVFHLSSSRSLPMHSQNVLWATSPVCLSISSICLLYLHWLFVVFISFYYIQNPGAHSKSSPWCYRSLHSHGPFHSLWWDKRKADVPAVRSALCRSSCAKKGSAWRCLCPSQAFFWLSLVFAQRPVSSCC